MKRLLIGLFVLSGTISLRADIIANGNFADGRAHWKGDAQETANAGEVDLTTGSIPSGILINLKKDKWAKVYQDIDVREAKLNYSISFSLASDYKSFPAPPAANGNLWLDLSDVPGFSGTARSVNPVRSWSSRAVD